MNQSMIVSASAMSDQVAIQSEQVKENITCLNGTHIISDHNAAHGHTEMIDDDPASSIVFTTKNVYFVVFVVVSVLCFVIATLVRHHQQKKHQHKKEQEFLRYYHSVLPHSRIYGNLNDIFASENSKMRRKNSKKQQQQEGGNTLKDKLMAAMYKKYPYNPYVSETDAVTKEEISDTGVDIVIENSETEPTEELDKLETNSNPDVKIQVTKKTVTWRKYSFPNISTVL